MLIAIYEPKGIQFQNHREEPAYIPTNTAVTCYNPLQEWWTL